MATGERGKRRPATQKGQLTLVLEETRPLADEERDKIEKAVRNKRKDVAISAVYFVCERVPKRKTDEEGADAAPETPVTKGGAKILYGPLGDSLNRIVDEAPGERVFWAPASTAEEAFAQYDRLLAMSAADVFVAGTQRRWELSGFDRAKRGIANGLYRIFWGVPHRDPAARIALFDRDSALEWGPRLDSAYPLAQLAANLETADQPVSEVELSLSKSASKRGGGVLRSYRRVAEFCRTSWSERRFPGGEQRDHEEPTSVKATAIHLVVLTLIASALFFTNLSHALVEPDETRYAQVPYEMVQSGDWLVPKRKDGKPFLDKPPLVYWMTAVCYTVLGTHELSARLPMAISALACVLACYGFGRSLVGSRAAFIGALALCLCGGFVVAGRFVLMDMTLTACTSIAFWSLIVACRREKFSWALFSVAIVAASLAVLTKGPIGLVLTLPPAFLHFWLTPTPNRLRILGWSIFLVGVAAIAAPWFVLSTMNLEEFGVWFWWRQHVVRYTDAFDHQEPWWYYGPALWVGMLPASLLLPGTLYWLFSQRSAYRWSRTWDMGALALYAGWVFLFFSASSCKLPTYLLPAVPSLALLIGSFVDRAILPKEGFQIEGSHWYVRHVLRDVPWIAALIALSAGGAMVYALYVMEPANQTALIAVASGVGGAVVVSLIVSFVFKAKTVKWGSAFAVAAAVTIVAFGYVYPKGAEYRSYVRFAQAEREALEQRLGVEGVPIVFVGTQLDGAGFTLPEGTFGEVPLTEPSFLVELLQHWGEVVMVAPPARLEELQAHAPAVLAIESLGERKFVHRVRLGGSVSNVAANWQSAPQGYATRAGYSAPPATYGQPGVPQYYGQSQALPPGMPATEQGYPAYQGQSAQQQNYGPASVPWQAAGPGGSFPR